MANFYKTKERGQSLVEVLVATAVIGMVLTSAAALVHVGLFTGRVSRENSFAFTLIQDMGTAIRGIAAIDWHLLWGPSGLAGYWGMEEGTGTRLFEPTGGNRGTLAGAVLPTWQATANCMVGTCLEFNGTAARVDVSPPLTNFPTTAITVSAWVRLTSHVDWNDLVVNNWGETGGWILFSNAAGTATFGVRAPGGVQHGASGCAAAFTLNTWHHLVGTYDGATVRVFLNGTQCATTSALANQTLFTGGTIRFGEVGTGSASHRLDEVKIFNRALSAAEIAAMHARPAGIHPQNLGGFWAMNEGSQTFSTALGTFRRWYTIQTVQRDAANNIVFSGGTPDPATVIVTYNVLTPRGKIITTTEFVTRSESHVTAQTDWSGGSVAIGIHPSGTNVFATSTNIDATSTPGTIRMIASGTEARLESVIFDTHDFGGVAFNYAMWAGSGGGGTDSRVDFRIASSNSATGPWEFLGPDCTTAAGDRYLNVIAQTQRQLIARCHTGHRYLRYRVYLVPIGGTIRPVVEDVIVGWSP